MNNFYKITQQVFFDLSTWLLHPDKYSSEQLSRLQNEEAYLPIISLAHQYWLVGPLTNRLKSADVWRKLPEKLQSYLIDIEKLYLNRINAIKAETIFVSQLLVDANIKVVVIKGAASIFNGVADPISNRYMKDIDILVPEQLQQKAYNILRKNGYKKDINYFDVNASDAHHAPPLLKNNICYIELHRWVVAKHLKKVLETDNVWITTVPLHLTDELIVEQLNPTNQVILSIVHSEIQNGGFDQKHIDLHQMFNLLTIVQHFFGKINWQLVKHCFEKSNQEDVLTTTLYVLYRLFELETPITNKQSIYAQKHFDECLRRYVKNQGRNSGFSVIMEQLYGYKSRNINLMYGKKGILGYPIGVMKHLFFHFRKVFSSPHIKSYVLRVINKRQHSDVS
ncbi:nucleotidyltransferase family protein [Colwellia sp. RE-S-Sl-9]